jgi:N-acyl-D-amino-acid deacylase
VRRIMAHELSVIGSDGIPHDEHPHPRLWGTFPRVLGHYVRDVGLFSLETAVHKMTGRAAEIFGIVDRGVLREGSFADLVLFDPGRVRDRATFEQPKQVSDGIEEVWCNGVPTYVAAQGGATLGATGERPGRLIRRGR